MAPSGTYLPHIAVIETYGDVSFNASGAADIIPLYDVAPAIIMGVQAIVILLLSTLMMFWYIPQDASYRGLGDYPVKWFWAELASRFGTQRWMALSYFTNFWMSILIAGMELIGMGLFATGMPEMAYAWTPTIGFYGAVFGYAVSPIFALTYLTQTVLNGGLEKVSYSADYTNTMFMCVVGFLQLYVATISHFLYTDRMVAYGHANFDKTAKVVAAEPETKVEAIPVDEADVPFNSNPMPESTGTAPEAGRSAAAK
jgi:hypothetical protein